MAGATRRVFILGAGASAPSGVPVVKHFFNAIEDSSHYGAPHFQDFIKGWLSLRRVHAKAQLDTQNIEEVLGAFELAALCGLELVPDVDPGSLVDAARLVIGNVITERAVVKPGKIDRGGTMNPDKVRSFAKVPGYRLLAAHAEGATFITFNQDLLLEFALDAAKIPFHYEGVQGRKQGSVPIAKLHGSLNWSLQGTDSDSVRVSTKPVYETMAARWLSEEYLRGELPESGFPFPFGEQSPLIVPPSWAKYSHYKPLENVWRRAVEALQEAQEIIVIGYSLPPADYFFRHLFAIGTISRARIRSFRLYDPAGDTVADRYRALLGAELRQVFESHPTRIEELKPGDLTPRG